MIHIVVALPAEARPLVSRYRLHRDAAHGAFVLYRGEHVTLVVSGPGKLAAAAATAWLGGLTATDLPAGWLNIGIAGHATHAIGSGLLVNRITDSSSRRSWYPPQVHDLDLPAGSLLSVDSPEHDYATDTLYDMEASGFYPVACRFSSGELVQCFKVVSDNRQQASDGVTAKLCTRLIDEQLPQIEQLVTGLEGLHHEFRHRHAPHPEHDRMTRQWHFSVSQQHRLTRLLTRWSSLNPQQPVWSSHLERMNNASAVLEHLQEQLDV